jgi:hypothetical protein
METQNMKRHVPEFQARKCQGKGTSVRMNAIKASVGKRGYVISLVVEDMAGEGAGARVRQVLKERGKSLQVAEHKGFIRWADQGAVAVRRGTMGFQLYVPTA